MCNKWLSFHKYRVKGGTWDNHNKLIHAIVIRIVAFICDK